MLSHATLFLSAVMAPAVFAQYPTMTAPNYATLAGACTAAAGTVVPFNNGTAELGFCSYAGGDCCPLSIYDPAYGAQPSNPTCTPGLSASMRYCGSGTNPCTNTPAPPPVSPPSPPAPPPMAPASPPASPAAAASPLPSGSVAGATNPGSPPVIVRCATDVSPSTAGSTTPPSPPSTGYQTQPVTTASLIAPNGALGSMPTFHGAFAALAVVALFATLF